MPGNLNGAKVANRIESQSLSQLGYPLPCAVRLIAHRTLSRLVTRRKFHVPTTMGCQSFPPVLRICHCGAATISFQPASTKYRDATITFAVPSREGP